MVTPQALERTVSFLKTLSWGWTRLKETCLPFCRYTEKETVLFPFRESLSLRVWVTVSGLPPAPFFPSLSLFRFFFFFFKSFIACRTRRREVTLAPLLRRWYLLPPRMRWAACTWPRSLSRIHLFWRVPTSDIPAWWWLIEDFGLKGFIWVPNSLKTSGFLFAGPHRRARQCDRNVYEYDLSQFSQRLRNISILQMAKWGSDSLCKSSP